jgi:putative drug exporter of the RND superfamily
LIRLTFETSAFQPDTAMALDSIRNELLGAPPGLQAHLSGATALYSDTKTTVQSSVDQTGPLTVVLVVLILLIIYRSPIAPVVPLATIGISYIISRSLIAIAGQYFNVSSLVDSFLIAVLFGAGTDYCLFLISRYREELDAGKPPKEAIVRTMEVIGETISSSAATVIAGLGAMAFAAFGLYNSIGPSIALGVLVTLLAGLTLTPALMAIFGRHLFWPNAPGMGRVMAKRRLWPAVGRLVSRSPVVIIVVVVVGLGAMSIASIGLTRDFDLMAGLPKNSDSIAGFRVISDHFGNGRALPLVVVINKGKDIQPDMRAIRKLTGDLLKEPGVNGVRSSMAPSGTLLPDRVLAATPAQIAASNPEVANGIASYLSGDKTAAKIEISLVKDPYSQSALNTLPAIREQVKQSLKGTSLENAPVLIGGATAITEDLRATTNDDTVRVTAIVLGAVFIILALLLRSVVAPVYLIITIILSYFSTLGIVTLIIQDWRGDPGVDWAVPFLVLIMIFALGEDYNIFLMSRVREEIGQKGTREGIRRAVERTGGIITSCGIIMIGTFAVLIISPVRIMAEAGLAIAIGIFFDTFVVRTILVPSIAVIVGKWSWWPRTPEEHGRFRLRQLPRTKDDVLT